MKIMILSLVLFAVGNLATQSQWRFSTPEEYAAAMLLPFLGILILCGHVAATLALGVCFVACWVSWWKK